MKINSSIDTHLHIGVRLLQETPNFFDSGCEMAIQRAEEAEEEEEAE